MKRDVEIGSISPTDVLSASAALPRVGQPRPDARPTADVAVVIAAYNAARWITRALQSVQRQTLAPREIIVVDDGSSDDTAEVARAACPEARVLRQRNAGPGAARNRGVAAATTRLVCFLDADDEHAPDMVLTLTRALAAWPEAAVAVGAYMWSTGDGTARCPPRGAIPTRDGVAVVRDLFAEMLRHPITQTGAVMLPREAFLAVGGFRQDVRYGEDMDLWGRLAGRYDWVYADDVVCIYNQFPETSLTLNTPNAELPADILMSEAKMRSHVRPELWISYRRFRRDYLAGQARCAMYERAPIRARSLLAGIAPAMPSLPWLGTWLAARLPGSCGRSVLLAARSVSRALKRNAVRPSNAPLES